MFSLILNVTVLLCIVMFICWISEAKKSESLVVMFCRICEEVVRIVSAVMLRICAECFVCNVMVVVEEFGN